MNYRSRIFLLGTLDAFLIGVVFFLVYSLRLDFDLSNPFFTSLPYVILINVIITLITFNYLKVYRHVWQYASIGELVAVIKGVTLSTLLFTCLYFILHSINTKWAIPRSVFLTSWALIIISVGGSRLVWRVIRDSYLNNSLKVRKISNRIMIIGAGSAGILVAKELKWSSDSEFYPVVFIDDESSKHRMEIMGIPVIGGREKILSTVELFNIQNIVIAMPSIPKEEIAKIIEICKHTACSIQILPKVHDLISGKVAVQMIRDVSVEDLLGREQVNVDLQEVAAYLKDQIVLVTGAGGSIGSELCRQISSFAPKSLLLLGHGENSIYEIEHELKVSYPTVNLETIIADVQDRARIDAVFREYSPSVVFHAAAHKHVPLMEKNPAEAIKNNILGTKNVAECADRYQTSHFVLISTDKAVNPTSVMGTTKRVAEMFVQGLGRKSQTKFVAVRFGNVLGSRGSVIPLFKKQIQQGGPVTVTHPEMIRYFMTIPEAVQLVIQAGALAAGGEVLILDMGNPVKISDLARDLIRLSGFKPDEDIKITYTGIRPGEKLFEEILTQEEVSSATKHDRIFVGKPMELAFETLLSYISRLEQMVHQEENRMDDLKIMLWRIVPTYQGVPEIVINDADSQLSYICDEVHTNGLTGAPIEI